MEQIQISKKMQLWTEHKEPFILITFSCKNIRKEHKGIKKKIVYKLDFLSLCYLLIMYNTKCSPVLSKLVINYSSKCNICWTEWTGIYVVLQVFREIFSTKVSNRLEMVFGRKQISKRTWSRVLRETFPWCWWGNSD